MGSILRTAECAGAHGVFIAERRAVGLTSVVAKVAPARSNTCRWRESRTSLD